MQEPIDHTAGREQSAALSDYRPDEGVLRLFRRMGRIGIAISLIEIITLLYRGYVALSYYRLIPRSSPFVPTRRLRTEYIIRFFSLSLMWLISFVCLIFLFKASRSLLQYGNDHNSQDIRRPVKDLYTWWVCLLIGVVISAIYFGYIFLSQKQLIG